jgi:hypothetical protein
MAFQPCPGIAGVTLSFTIDDAQPAVNTFYVRTNDLSTWTSGDLAFMTTAFHDWFNAGDGAGATYKSRVHELVTLVDIIATDLSVEGSVQHIRSDGSAGTDSGNPLPNGVSIAISERSAFIGRSHRGRKFFVGLTDTSVDSDHPNIVNDGFVADILPAFNSLIGHVTGYGGAAAAQLVVLSRKHNGAFRDEGIGTVVNQYTLVDTNLDYQRRRAPGHNRGG